MEEQTSMRSVPIIIIVLILVVGGIWFLVDRLDTPAEEIKEVNNSDMLESANRLAIMERDVNFEDGRKEFFAEPLDVGAYPGVVMIHEWWGLTKEVKDMARELAGQGYKVLAVDLYNGKVATSTADAQKYRAARTPEETTKVLKEAVAFLKAEGAIKVASLGWCYGGGKSLELALSGEPLDATVIYYGQLSTDPEKLSALKWPVLGIFGGKDQSISTSTVREFDAALDRLGIENEIYVYPEVGHAFANPSGMNYAPAETKDAWAKTLTFLEQSLK